MLFVKSSRMAVASIKSKLSTRPRASAKSKAPKKSGPAGNSYNRFKEFHGQQYTGMKVGRSHKWNYDQGEWRETKITPDLWEISYAVTKRRAGKAPEGSGVPVGTGYHWYIVAHQEVIKLNANDYSTAMTGLKFKLAHKRADKDKWNASAKAQRKREIKFLQDLVTQLEKEPIPIEVEVKGKKFTGEAIPIKPTCHDGICEELEVTLNEEHLGILKHSKSGWKMDLEHDPELIEALGEKIQLWYE
jgi:hypothetical protein